MPGGKAWGVPGTRTCVPQGSAAEVFKRALRMCKHMELADQLHDELLIDGAVKLPDGLESLIPGLHTPISLKRMVRWE